jgi:hypothetical protein
MSSNGPPPVYFSYAELAALRSGDRNLVTPLLEEILKGDEKERDSLLSLLPSATAPTVVYAPLFKVPQSTPITIPTPTTYSNAEQGFTPPTGDSYRVKSPEGTSPTATNSIRNKPT